MRTKSRRHSGCSLSRELRVANCESLFLPGRFQRECQRQSTRPLDVAVIARPDGDQFWPHDQALVFGEPPGPHRPADSIDPEGRFWLIEQVERPIGMAITAQIRAGDDGGALVVDIQKGNESGLPGAPSCSCEITQREVGSCGGYRRPPVAGNEIEWGYDVASDPGKRPLLPPPAKEVLICADGPSSECGQCTLVNRFPRCDHGP
jgi:hypothetical protein